MLSDIPGIGAALIVLLTIVFAWCFIFTACFAAFRLAQRPRLGKVTKAGGALRYPKEWMDSPANTRSNTIRHERFGDHAMRRAPGPRDWEPSI